MNKLFKKAMILGGIGFVLGLLIGLIIYGADELINTGTVSVASLSLFELLVGGAQGFLAMASTVVYEIESWSIARATFTHFVVTLGGYLGMGYLQGWLLENPVFTAIMAAIFIIVYIIIWQVQYMKSLRDVRQMNEDLGKMKKD